MAAAEGGRKKEARVRGRGGLLVIKGRRGEEVAWRWATARSRVLRALRTGRKRQGGDDQHGLVPDWC